MSVFECKVSELNENKDKISSFETSTVTSPSPSTNTNTNTISSTNQDVNQVPSSSKNTGNVSGFSKILNEKNLKAILLIACVYFLLHSEPVLEFVNSKIPSIISNLTLNSLGKLIFGLLLGVLFIVGSFFFQDP
jgi:hypothetical protein